MNVDSLRCVLQQVGCIHFKHVAVSVRHIRLHRQAQLTATSGIYRHGFSARERCREAFRVIQRPIFVHQHSPVVVTLVVVALID